MARYEVTGTYGGVPIRPTGLEAESIEDARIRAESKGIRLKSIRPLDETGESAWSPGPPPVLEAQSRRPWPGRPTASKPAPRYDDGPSLADDEPSTFVPKGKPVPDSGHAPTRAPEPRSMAEMLAELISLQQKTNQLLYHGLKPRGRQYRVLVVVEGIMGTIFLGSSKLSAGKLEAAMNRLGREGWEFEFMSIESRRVLLFWQREAAIITFSRPSI